MINVSGAAETQALLADTPAMRRMWGRLCAWLGAGGPGSVAASWRDADPDAKAQVIQRIKEALVHDVGMFEELLAASPRYVAHAVHSRSELRGVREGVLRAAGGDNKELIDLISGGGKGGKAADLAPLSPGSRHELALCDQLVLASGHTRWPKANNLARSAVTSKIVEKMGLPYEDALAHKRKVCRAVGQTRRRRKQSQSATGVGDGERHGVARECDMDESDSNDESVAGGASGAGTHVQPQAVSALPPQHSLSGLAPPLAPPLACHSLPLSVLALPLAPPLQGSGGASTDEEVT
jgi:hypothetical protein